MTFIKTYSEELQDLHHRRVYHIALFGGLLMVIFGLLDYVVVPEFFQEFAGYRVSVAICSIVLLACNYFDKAKRFASFIGFTEYLIIALVLLFMIDRMGGVVSPYYVGLIVAISIYSTLAPLTAPQTIFCGLFIIFFYALTVQYENSELLPFSRELLHNLFFMICFVLILAIQSWTETSARKNEYRLRQKEQSANTGLTRQSMILEREVKRRTREQKATEERYRFLFSQITDGVVVITPGGKILQANNCFTKTYLGSEQLKNNSFFNLVSPGNMTNFLDLLSNVLNLEKPIQAAKISLTKGDGTICEVETNLSLVSRSQGDPGIQLVIRDLSARKQLEDRLITSLKLKKETESAAIMALAKLSEYREFTPEKHLERIREYCQTLATQLSSHKDFATEITSNFVLDIYHASILHDIGKVAIPDALLKKKPPLTEHELETIRRHTLLGGDVIRDMENESQKNSFLPMAKDITYFHHERWDGQGYPHGLKQSEIPLAARIMAIADFYEEMTTATTDQPSLSHEEAVQAIVQSSNLQFDPRIVEALFLCQEEFRQIKETYEGVSS